MYVVPVGSIVDTLVETAKDTVLPVPVVSVWGATHPYAGFNGWGQSNENVMQLALACRPCSVFGNKPCYRGDHACMQGISEEMIFQKIVLGLNQ